MNDGSTLKHPQKIERHFLEILLEDLSSSHLASFPYSFLHCLLFPLFFFSFSTLGTLFLKIMTCLQLGILVCFCNQHLMCYMDIKCHTSLFLGPLNDLELLLVSKYHICLTSFNTPQSFTFPLLSTSIFLKRVVLRFGVVLQSLQEKIL